MAFDFTGGVAAATGYMQGRDEATARDNLAEDRDFQKTQRVVQQQQQQRTKDQWGREDAERTAVKGIDPNAPQDVQLRAAAAAKRQSGDIKSALEMHDQADKIAIARAEKNVQTILAGSQGKSAAQLATEAAEVLNADPVPGGIANVRDDGNGGVIMDVTDNITKQTVQKQFANADQTREWLQAYKAPAVYASLQKMKQAALSKAQEPHVIPAGGALSVGGRIVASNDNGMVQVGTNDDGTPILARASARIGPGGQPIGGSAGGGSGTGAGKGAGKGNSGDTVTDARAILASAAEKSEDKMSGDQRLAAEDHVARIATQNPKVPAAMVARVAVDIAKNPAKVQPAIDPETGKIDLVYDDGINGKIKVNVGVGDAINLQSVKQAIAQKLTAANGGKAPAPADIEAETRKQMTGMTKSMMTDFDPKNRDAYVLAAYDGKERAKLEAQLRSQAEAVIQQAGAGKSPEQQEAIRKNTEQALQQRINALGNVLNLVSNYGEKPAGAQPKRGVQAPGGLAMAASYTPPADSKVGKMRARADAEQAQRQSSEQADQKQREAQRPAAQAEAQRLLATGNRKDLAEFQTMPAFELLDKQTQLAIHQRVNSIR